MAQRLTLSLTINGRARTLEVAVHHTLLEVLREEVDLTGTKECCVVGECGACTVLVDGRSVNSCLMLAVEADGCEVLTVEGLAVDGELDPLQTAFLDQSAAQCGFCIPGQLMSATALLERIDDPTDEQIQEALAGNLCRCAGYEQIFKAVHQAARQKQRPSVRAGAMTTEQKIGVSPHRVGGFERVTGAQEYLADIPFEDVLHVKLVTIPCGRARIVEHRHQRCGGRARRGAGDDRCRPAPAGAAIWTAVPGPSRPGRGRDQVPRRAGGGRRGRDQGRG